MGQPERVSRRTDLEIEAGLSLPQSRLILTRTADGDIIIAFGFGTSVVFCPPSRGGGKSPHTWRALVSLFEAMKKDEAVDNTARDSEFSDAFDVFCGRQVHNISPDERFRQEVLVENRL